MRLALHYLDAQPQTQPPAISLSKKVAYISSKAAIMAASWWWSVCLEHGFPQNWSAIDPIAAGSLFHSHIDHERHFQDRPRGLRLVAGVWLPMAEYCNRHALRNHEETMA